MPQYVPLSQQGFYEPFQALGHGIATALGLVQNSQQMKQQQKQFDAEQALKQKQFDLMAPQATAAGESAQVDAAAKKRSDFLQHFDAQGALVRPLLTAPDRAGLPTEGLDPQAAQQYVEQTPFEQLPSDTQRFVHAQVQQEAGKQGVGAIDPSEVIQAYRQKQYSRIAPGLPPGMQVTGGKIALPGAGEVNYQANGEGGAPLLEPKEQATIAGGLNKEATAAYKNYFDSHESYRQMLLQVQAADLKPATGNATAAEDVSIMNLYLNTIDPRIRLTPNSTEDLKHHVESLPSKWRIAANKLVGGSGSLTGPERHELLEAAYRNSLGHHQSAMEQAGVISDSGKALGAGNFSIGIKPKVNPPSPPAGFGHETPSRTVSGAPHGGGDSSQPGTSAGPASSGITPTLWTQQDFYNHKGKGSFIWGPTGQKMSY